MREEHEHNKALRETASRLKRLSYRELSDFAESFSKRFREQPFLDQVMAPTTVAVLLLETADEMENA